MDILNLWFLGKIAFLFAIAIYVFFAFVVVKQVFLMTSTIQTGVEFFVKTIAWMHLLAAITVFLLALVIL